MAAPRSLDEWLAYQARVHPQAIDLGLARLVTVLHRLQWRRPPVPVISIAGTNGKGSVAAYCTSILAAAGYRVGTFTSPHLRDYRERIRIGDRNVGTDTLLAAFERIEAARGDVGLTFFEYNSLAAFLVFEAAALDAWVLEIGMGGRLDAVNAVDADVAVVVSVGFDHQEYLGATLEAIGREKAGIFRTGRPAVLGSRHLPAVVETTAAAIGATPKRIGIEFDFARGADCWSYRGSRWQLPNLPPPALQGDSQYGNAATALAALEELDVRLPVTAAAVAAGLTAVRLSGRFQVIAPAMPDRPTWILDVAHNADAAAVLAGNLRALAGGGRCLGVCGILADKDAAAIVRELRGSIDAWWFVPIDGARGRSGALLAASVAGQLAAPATVVASVAEACAEAAALASGADRICVFGSFHIVGPALDWLEAQGLLPRAQVPEYTASPMGT